MSLVQRIDRYPNRRRRSAIYVPRASPSSACPATRSTAGTARILCSIRLVRPTTHPSRQS